MSADVPQIECRLCGTLYPETNRFCPNCREPSPEVHEDLLMAARLTDVSYEILLQRAWAAEGLAAAPRRRGTAAAGTPAPDAGRRGWVPGAVVERTRRQRDAFAIGCIALLALLTLGVVGFLLVQVLGDDDGDSDDTAGAVVTATFTPAADAPTATERPEPGATGAAGGGTGAQGSPMPTSEQLPLILEAGQTATYADGYTALIQSYDSQVFSEDPANSPEFGFRFVAVEVQTCSGEAAADAGPGDWLLEMPDGEQFPVIELPVEPVLPEGELAAGECAAGWVAFEIPIDPDPLYVVHANPAYATTRFAWPG